MNHFSGESIRSEVEYELNQVINAILYDFAGSSVKVRKQANVSCSNAAGDTVRLN